MLFLEFIHEADVKNIMERNSWRRDRQASAFKCEQRNPRAEHCAQQQQQQLSTNRKEPREQGVLSLRNGFFRESIAESEH